MRFVLVGRRRERQDFCPVVFVSKSGFPTFNAERAYVYRSRADVDKELIYWNTIGAPTYCWSIEQLPARMSVARAVLFAKEVS